MASHTELSLQQERMQKFRKNKELWSDMEIKLLIKVWALYNDDLKTSKRNRHVHENIRLELLNAGVVKTAEAVKIKIQNLTAQFRKEKREHDCLGSGPSIWPFYDDVKAIVGGLPLNTSSKAGESLEMAESMILEVEYSDASEGELEVDLDEPMAVGSGNINGATSAVTFQLQKFRKNKEMWSDKDVKLLIKFWALYNEDLRTSKRNRHVHEKIRLQLLNAGVGKTAEAVKIKIQNLTAHFRKEKREHESAGSSPSTWPFYDDVKAILDGLPLNNSSKPGESVEIAERIILENSDASEVELEGDLDNPSSITPGSSTTSVATLSPESTDESSTSQEKWEPNSRKTSSKRIKPSSKKISSKKGQLDAKTACLRALEIIAEEAKRSNEIASRFEEKALSLMEHLTNNQERSLAMQQALVNGYLKTIGTSPL
ncbi:hypothetical protein CHUAL_008198 [Chamberlinius hualienensis]